MPLTPEEQARLQEALAIGRAIRGEGTAPPPGAATQPQVPVQREADLREAEADLLRAAAERYGLKNPGPLGDKEAADLVAKIRAKPADLPAEPTWTQQLQRSLLPRQLVGDERPLSAAELAQKAGELVVGINPTSVPAQAMRLLKGQGDRFIPEDEKGIPQEPAVFAAMRVAGSAIPALVVESLGRVPLPTTTVGELVTGAPVTSHQKVRRDNVFGDWAQGVLERMEEGRGLEGDFEEGFRQRFGEEWATTGYGLGLLIDIFTGWEDGLAKAVSAPLKTASQVAELRKLDPGGRVLGALQTAVRGTEVEAGEYIGGKLVAGLESGELSIDDIPTDIRLRMEEVVRTEYGMSLVELAKLEGIGAPRTVEAADPEFIKAQDALAQAEAANKAVKGARKKGEAVTLTPEQKAQRARLPPFEQPIQWAHQYWEGAKRLNEAPDRPALGYDTPRGDAFSRYADADKQTIDSPEYVVRSLNGDVVSRPVPFDQAIILAARRKAQGLDGDEIWYGLRRPVARWGVSKSGGGEKLAVNWHFGSRSEENFVARLAAAGDPAVFPGRARQIKAGKEAMTAGSILADALTKAPGPSISAKTRLGHVAQEGTRLAVRDKMGSSRLEQLSTGAFVAKGERKRLNKQAEKQLGLSGDRALEVFRGGSLTDAERKALAQAADRLGVTLPTKTPPAPLQPATPPPSTLSPQLQQALDIVTKAGEGSTSQLQREMGLGYGPAAKLIDELEQLGYLQAATKGKLKPRRLVKLKPPKPGPVQGPAAPTAPDFDFSPETYRGLLNKALEREAGVLADMRYRVSGTRPWVDRFFQVLSDAHLDRKKWGPIAKAVLTRGPVSWLSEAFLEDKLGQLPKAVQGKLREMQSKLERNADDLTDEFQVTEGASVPQRLLSVMRGHIEVMPDELARSVAIRQQNLETPTGAAEVQRLLGELDRTWRGPRPDWLTSGSETQRIYGAMRWARSVEEVAAELGRKWVASHLLAVGREVRGTTLFDALRKEVDRELGASIFRELYADGNFTGPALAEALRRLQLGPIKLDVEKAVVAHALTMRHERIVSETMEELLGSGLAVKGSDPRQQALAAVVNGTHKAWNPQLRRWEYAFPEAQVTWALGRLRDWGMEPGAESAVVTRALGERQVTLPKYLADEIAEMVSAGALDSRSVYGKGRARDVLNTLTRNFKEWTTHGVFLPNPAYFTGQMLGMWPVLATTRGLSGAARVGAGFIKHPMVTSELMKRLGGEGMPIFVPRDPSAFVLKTESGAIYTLDELESMMRRWGVHETKTAYETAARFADVIALEQSAYSALNPLRLKLPAARLQQTIRKFAGSFDLAGRIGVFLDELASGASPDVAARAARESILDFRNMTRFERDNMRQIFTFYAFMRKNSDAYIRALFHNPSRVLAQMRLAEASISSSGLTDIELGAMLPQDLGRFTLYDDDEVVSESGRVHPLYRFNRLQSTPIGVAEWLSMMMALLGTASFDEESARQTLGQVSPLGQTLAILALGQRLDKDFDTARQNRVPPVLLDSFMGPLFREAFGVGPLALTDTEDPLLKDDDATDELGSGERAVWAAGAARGIDPATAETQRRLWQLFSTWLSRPIGTLQQGAEALPGLLPDVVQRPYEALPRWVPVLPTEKPPPHLTEEEATMAFLLGMRFRPALDEQEATRRALRRREAAYGEAQEEVQLPDSAVRR